MDKRLEKWRMTEEESALLGAAAAFLSFSDCKLILHSPMWCASITERKAAERCPSCAGRIFSTFEEEKNLVFGGRDKLIAAVRDAGLCENDHLLGVALQCGPALVGDDIEGICHTVTDVPIAVSDASGFSGEFSKGWANAMIAALKAANTKALDKIPGLVNLIGVSIFEREENDRLKGVFEKLEAEGMKINCVLGAANSQWSDLANWRRAEKNIVLHSRGQEVAKWLENAWQEPWLVMNSE